MLYKVYILVWSDFLRKIIAIIGIIIYRDVCIVLRQIQQNIKIR